MVKIYCLIGKIVSGFVRTEYLLSQIVSDIGLRKLRTDFFSDGRTSVKLLELIQELSKSDIPKKEDYILLIRRFDEIREDRNMIVHSLVLTNVVDESEFMFHNYLKTKGTVLNKSKRYTKSDLKKIHIEIIEIHNKLVTLHFEEAN